MRNPQLQNTEYRIYRIYRIRHTQRDINNHSAQTYKKCHVLGTIYPYNLNNTDNTPKKAINCRLADQPSRTKTLRVLLSYWRAVYNNSNSRLSSIIAEYGKGPRTSSDAKKERSQPRSSNFFPYLRAHPHTHQDKYLKVPKSTGTHELPTILFSAIFLSA